MKEEKSKQTKIFKLTQEFIEELRELIEQKDKKKTKEILSHLYAADIAEIYNDLSIEEAKYLFLFLEKDKAADVIAELDDHDRERFLKALPSEIIAKRFIQEMDSDDAADVLGEMTDERKEEVLSHIDNQEQAGDIVDLLTYDEDTAGGLMGKEFISVKKDLSVSRSIITLRNKAAEVDEIYYIYVVNENGILEGTLSLKRLLLSQVTDKISDIYNAEVISVKTDTSAVEVGQIMTKYDLIALPVVDSIGRLKGRITIDDVVDVMQEEAEKDYQMISGLTDVVETNDGVFTVTKARFPWLLIGLLGGIIGARIISLFEGDISKYTGLAMFLPLIAAMGGNVGVQSSSIIVQGLANQSIGKQNIISQLSKEFVVSLLNGVLLSSLIFLYNYFFCTSYSLTISVSIALFSVIIFASFFGTLVPLILNKYKIDPALATGPFITTVNDIMGLFIYLSISRFIFDGIIF